MWTVSVLFINKRLRQKTTRTLPFGLFSYILTSYYIVSPSFNLNELFVGKIEKTCLDVVFESYPLEFRD